MISTKRLPLEPSAFVDFTAISWIALLTYDLGWETSNVVKTPSGSTT